MVSGKVDYVGNVFVYSGTATPEADVVAAKPVFTKQPSPLVGPGANFAPDLVLIAAYDTEELIYRNYQVRFTIDAVAVEDTSKVVSGLTAAPGVLPASAAHRAVDALPNIQ